MRIKVSPLVVALFFVACGGATQSDLFGGGGGNPGPQDDSGVADTGSSGGDSGNGDVDAGTGVDAGRRKDGGGPVDAGGPPDTGVVVDTGTPDPGIYCGKGLQGDVFCEVGQQTCCATGQGGGTPVYKCEAAASLACVDLTIHCDDPADCAGEFCCGTLTNQGYREVTCRAQCSLQDQTLRRFCDPFAQPSNCPPNMMCGPSQILPGFHVCQ